MRAPARVGGPPASFGRGEADGGRQEDFTVRGGQSIHLVVHADVTPDPVSLEALHTAIRETTRAAVLAGYADAFAAMDDVEQEPPGGVHGGAPPGPTPVG